MKTEPFTPEEIYKALSLDQKLYLLDLPTQRYSNMSFISVFSFYGIIDLVRDLALTPMGNDVADLILDEVIANTIKQHQRYVVGSTNKRPWLESNISF